MVNLADPAVMLPPWQPIPCDAALLKRAGHATVVVGSTIFFTCGRDGCGAMSNARCRQ